MALTQMYKKYMILQQGGSFYIFCPESPEIEEEYPLSHKSQGYSQSMPGARRWINQEIRNRYIDEVKQEMVKDGYRVD